MFVNKFYLVLVKSPNYSIIFHTVHATYLIINEPDSIFAKSTLNVVRRNPIDGETEDNCINYPADGNSANPAVRSRVYIRSNRVVERYDDAA